MQFARESYHGFGNKVYTVNVGIYVLSFSRLQCAHTPSLCIRLFRNCDIIDVASFSKGFFLVSNRPIRTRLFTIIIFVCRIFVHISTSPFRRDYCEIMGVRNTRVFELSQWSAFGVRCGYTSHIIFFLAPLRLCAAVCGVECRWCISCRCLHKLSSSVRISILFLFVTDVFITYK